MRIALLYRVMLFFHSIEIANAMKQTFCVGILKQSRKEKV
jgi:hypothetical protein